MALALPPINTFGIFTVLVPFNIDPVKYRCESIQSIAILVQSGLDVFNTYYVPVGLLIADYQTDVTNNVSIVTLTSDDGPTKFIPSSYIDTMPTTALVPYSHLWVSLELGILPDELPVGQLLLDLNELAESTIGVTVITKIHLIPSSVSYTQEEYQVNESVRQQAVITRTSDARARQLAETELVNARQHIADLEATVISLQARL